MGMGAMQKLGLGAMLSLSGRGYIDEMGRARDATGKFVQTVDLLPPGLKQVAQASMMLNASLKRMSRGFGMIGSGLQSVGMAALPISAGLGLAVKQAADFERNMKAVEAVTSFTVDNYKDLGGLAKEIGIVTQYDPKEASKLMEGMGRAGATYQEVMGGAMGIASAAAAEQMDLATAQNVVTQSARIMGISLTEATRIADSYAKLSANANTNITELGEAFKYAGPSARKMGMDFDTTLAFLAKLGDAGLKGSIGGTALQNMMNKITRRSKKAQVAMKSMHISMVDGNKKFRGMTDILNDVVNGLSSMENEEERAALVSELFGIRGERAYLAFSTQGKKSFDEMIAMSKKASMETDKDGKVVGAAYLMAQKRLEGLSGRLTLFRGSIVTFAIEAGEQINQVLGSLAGDALKSFNKVLRVFSLFDAALSEFDGVRKLRKEFGNTAVDIVIGFRDALKTIRWAITETIKKVKEFGRMATKYLGEDGVQKLTKFLTLATVILGAMGPIALAMWPIKMALSGIAAIVGGIATAFWPFTLAALFLAGVFAAMKKDGETWGETILRVFGELKDTVMNIYDKYIEPFVRGMSDTLPMAIEDLGKTFESLGKTIETFFGNFSSDIQKTDTQIKESSYSWGVYFMAFITTVLQTVAWLVNFIVYAFDIIMTPIQKLVVAFGELFDAIVRIFSGGVLEGFKRLGLALLDAVAWPLRKISAMMVSFADKIGYDLPGLKLFAEGGASSAILNDQTGVTKRGGVKVAPKETSDKTINSMADIMNRKLPDKTFFADSFKLGMEAYSPNGFAANVKLDNKLCIDGEAGNRAFARNSAEVKERMGMKASPYQYRTVREHGVQTG